MTKIIKNLYLKTKIVTGLKLIFMSELLNILRNMVTYGIKAVFSRNVYFIRPKYLNFFLTINLQYLLQ